MAKHTIDKTTVIDKPTEINWASGDTVDLAPLEKLGHFIPAFNVVKGGKLKIKAEGATISIPRWSRLVTIAGGECEIYDPTIDGPGQLGQLVHAAYGTKILIRNADYKAPAWKYCAYFGDWMLKLDKEGNYHPDNPGDMRGIDVDGFNVPYGSIGDPDNPDDGESPLRVMGGFGIIKNFLLDNSKNPNGKQGLAARHGCMFFENGLIITKDAPKDEHGKVAKLLVHGTTSAVIGRLDPSKKGAGIPYKNMPGINAYFLNCTMAGYMQLEGDVKVVQKKTHFMFRDPRKVGGDVAVQIKTYLNYAKAECLMIDCDQGPFSALGGKPAVASEPRVAAIIKMAKAGW